MGVAGNKRGFVVKCVCVCPYSTNVDGMRMMCVMVICLCGYGVGD